MPTIFEEDDVLDWFAEAGETGAGARQIRRALTEAMKNPDELDRTDAGRILAVAEWIAALRGHKSSDANQIIDDLLSRSRPKMSDELVALSLNAVNRIEKQSETRSLWEEAGYLPDWQRAVGDLQKRLKKVPVDAPRPKRVRLSTGDLFRIDLPGGDVAWGRVADHLAGEIQIYESRVDPRSVPLHERKLAFTLLLASGPLESGEWPVISKGRKEAPQRLASFQQHQVWFSTLKDYYGRPSTVRECAGLESSWFWPAEDVIERIVNGHCSPKLVQYWPKCLDEGGNLEPKCWARWTEEDFRRMEKAAEQEERTGNGWW